jgi:hypothetical protein
MDSIVGAARAREAFVGTLLLRAAAASLFVGATGIYHSVAHAVDTPRASRRPWHSAATDVTTGVSMPRTRGTL